MNSMGNVGQNKAASTKSKQHFGNENQYLITGILGYKTFNPFTSVKSRGFSENF